MVTVTIKQGKFKGGKLYDVSTCCMKFLKYDPFEHQIENIHHVQVHNNPIGVKVQGALDAMDYCFISTLGCYFKLVWGEMCCKGIVKLKA
jgi:hypothetical protein